MCDILAHIFSGPESSVFNFYGPERVLQQSEVHQPIAHSILLPGSRKNTQYETNNKYSRSNLKQGATSVPGTPSIHQEQKTRAQLLFLFNPWMGDGTVENTIAIVRRGIH